MAGEHKSPFRGFAIEFTQHREYVPGDDVRFIDWNLFARLERLYLKLFLEEEDLHFYTLIDTSTSMEFGEPTKLYFAKQLAAALGFIGLCRADRVKIESLGTSSRKPGPTLRGRSSLWRMQEYLEGIEPGENVSLAEEHLHDLYPAFPIVPHSLIVEGMAQTAGILVGEARNFSEKVILAKIGRATFHRLVRPGDTIVFSARIDQMSEQGASITGTVTVASRLVAEIELMFSHIDQNLAGLRFPEHNFVFTEQFTELLKTYRDGADVTI